MQHPYGLEGRFVPLVIFFGFGQKRILLMTKPPKAEISLCTRARARARIQRFRYVPGARSRTRVQSEISASGGLVVKKRRFDQKRKNGQGAQKHMQNPYGFEGSFVPLVRCSPFWSKTRLFDHPAPGGGNFALYPAHTLARAHSENSAKAGSWSKHDFFKGNENTCKIPMVWKAFWCLLLVFFRFWSKKVSF